MKKVLIIIMFTCYFSIGIAQTTEAENQLKTTKKDSTEGWKKGGTITVNLTQVSLTNWSAGGQNSISANEILNLYAHNKNGKGLWENYLDISYGSIKQGSNDNWWKTDDKIDFTSKYGREAFSKWYYAALLNFKTQLTPGYNYPNDSTKISGLFSPGYLLGAIGLDYKPQESMSAFLAPITSKMTIVTDQDLADAGAFGVEAGTYDDVGKIKNHGKNMKTELGGYARFFFKKTLMENIDMQTKFDLFSNYMKKPQNIDISWEVLISMKVNKYISATLSTHLLYDDDIDIAIDDNDDGITDKVGPRTQFKEVLGIGFSYKF